MRDAVDVRLRPILMTTVTTVCGLSPLVFLPGAGTELYRGLGAIVLFGLLFSTAVTLVFLPALLVEFATAYAGARPGHCQPHSFCTWDEGLAQCRCALDPSDPLHAECTEKNPAGEDAICAYAVKDIDCPEGGCFGFGFKLAGFATDPVVDPRPAATCFPDDADWNVPFVPAAEELAGTECFDPMPPAGEFCGA